MTLYCHCTPVLLYKQMKCKIQVNLQVGTKKKLKRLMTMLTLEVDKTTLKCYSQSFFPRTAN